MKWTIDRLKPKNRTVRTWRPKPKRIFFLLKVTLPETYLAPENRPSQKKMIIYSNHPFSGAKLLSFREGIPAEGISSGNLLAPRRNSRFCWKQLGIGNRRFPPDNMYLSCLMQLHMYMYIYESTLKYVSISEYHIKIQYHYSIPIDTSNIQII